MRAFVVDWVAKCRERGLDWQNAALVDGKLIPNDTVAVRRLAEKRGL